MIVNTTLACQESGMPMQHAQAFQDVANRTDCVIASRSVGKWATSLILESYASKGFHVKAKSCNWGPMAGFVCSDPRFSKNGLNPLKVASQLADVRRALRGGAQTTPLKIPLSRVNHLLWTLQCMTIVSATLTELTVTTAAPCGTPFLFVLRRELTQSINHEPLYSVLYHPSVQPFGFGQVQHLINRFGNNAPNQALRPVLAMVNPNSEIPTTNYRSALTGDYDLWGIYPGGDAFNWGGDDNRPVTQANLIAGNLAAEDPHLGNITPRVKRAKVLLNDKIKSTGYRGGNMVHHSDELGRPFVNEIELEFIAFVPRQHNRARFINTDFDFQIFTMDCHSLGYTVSYNPLWNAHLDRLNWHLAR